MNCVWVYILFLMAVSANIEIEKNKIEQNLEKPNQSSKTRFSSGISSETKVINLDGRRQFAHFVTKSNDYKLKPILRKPLSSNMDTATAHAISYEKHRTSQGVSSLITHHGIRDYYDRPFFISSSLKNIFDNNI